MTDYSHMNTADLITHFIDGASRLGSVFNLPFKMNRQSAEAQAIGDKMQLIGQELKARKPISDLRPLYDHPNEDVRYWAAGQFRAIDPEWSDAVYGAVRENLSTGEVIALVQRAKKKPQKQPALSDMSIADLAERYNDAATRLYAAAEFISDENGLPDTKTYNRILGEIGDVRRELEAGHALTALLPFLEHPNPIIRRVAASSCLSIASDRAIPILESIANGKYGGERASARRTLDQWRRKQSGAPQG
ncbi:DUF2019 domain-containing protein [Methyloferula stellata]|uniref:DUF2019 domain-containing protein n=1 Tax=Methyloferula stellata TaxID=876270 RepID=UPI00039B1F57|nr:DUF2019 domain-containing protein [Methyloferula stellata]